MPIKPISVSTAATVDTEPVGAYDASSCNEPGT